jgi:cytidine deaminase
LEVDFSSYGDKFDPLSLLFDLGPFLIGAARAIRRKEAVSYRGFLVGAVAISTNELAGELGAYIGFNYTPYGGMPKRCAEVHSRGRAISDGRNRLDVCIAAGTTNVDDIEGVNYERTPTLRPCDNPCLPLMEDATVIVSVGANDDIYEAHTGEQLREIRQQRDSNALLGQYSRKRKQAEGAYTPQPVPVCDPGFVDWPARKTLYEELTTHLGYGSDCGTRNDRAEAAVFALRASGAELTELRAA